MINIAEILKNYPRGAKLYSPICGECEVVSVTNKIIKVRYENDGFDCEFAFTKFGRYYDFEESECLLFPSKDNRDWLTFDKYKLGDFVVSDNGSIGVFKHYTKRPEMHCCICALVFDGYLSTKNHYMTVIRRATSEEKQKLIDALIRHGYTLNEKFELLKIQYKDEFNPFDRVLVRDYKDEEWSADLFSHLSKSEDYQYYCVSGGWKYCIPYEGNEHLLGTSNSE